jgi:glucose/arabinose dehydrogenase
MKTLLHVLLLCLVTATARAQINAGELKPEPSLPFTMTQVATFTFYKGAMFPQWNGSALMSGLATKSLSRITFDGKGGAAPAERWNVGHRIRDVEVGPDGALWMIEDANPGGLFRVTPNPSGTGSGSGLGAR